MIHTNISSYINLYNIIHDKYTYYMQYYIDNIIYYVICIAFKIIYNKMHYIKIQSE